MRNVLGVLLGAAALLVSVPSLAETALTPSDLIWPLFVTEGQDIEEPIGSLPGVSRWSIDRLGERAREARDLGIPCIAFFPNTPSGLRSESAEEALNRPIERAVHHQPVSDDGHILAVAHDVGLAERNGI